MAQAEAAVRRIEAEVALAIGQIKLVNQLWDSPIDSFGTARAHHVQLSCLSCFNSASGCFPDRWGPRRFEPIGDVFFLPAGQLFHSRSACRHQSSISCDFDPAAVARWFDDASTWTDSQLEACLDIASIRIRGLLSRIGEELRAPGLGSEAMIELMVAQLAIELSRHLAGVGASRVTGGLSPWRLRLIDERLAEAGAAPALVELADACRMSVRHLTRAFHNSRGRSLGSHIAERRADQARQLLSSGLSIKVVALRMGCSAPSNFANAFRRTTGETPSAYRQRAGFRTAKRGWPASEIRKPG